MKKNQWLLLIFLFLFTGSNIGQGFHFYPIPSYNILVKSFAAFQETFSVNCREKRTIKIKVMNKTQIDTLECFAIVYIYSLDLQDKLGPFIVNCGETLTQEIDERMWGATVESDYSVIASVWIEELNKSGKGSKENSSSDE